MFDDADGALSIVVANEHRDRVECVEEEMGVELCLESSKTGAGKLFRESCDLYFAIACIDEVARCVLDSDHTEIDCDAERKGREDPAQPFDSKSKPEFSRALLHRCVINLGSKNPDQNKSQHLAQGGPCYAEQ